MRSLSEYVIVTSIDKFCSYSGEKPVIASLGVIKRDQVHHVLKAIKQHNNCLALKLHMRFYSDQNVKSFSDFFKLPLTMLQRLSLNLEKNALNEGLLKFLHNSSIRILEIQDARLSFTSVEAINQWLRQCGPTSFSLTTVILDNCGLDELFNGCSSVYSLEKLSLENMTTRELNNNSPLILLLSHIRCRIRELNVCGTNIGCSWEVLGDALVDNFSVEVLNLSGCKINPSDMASFAEKLTHTKSLESLELNDLSTEVLTEFLPHLPKLRLNDLRMNKATERKKDEKFSELLKMALLENTSLRHFEFDMVENRKILEQLIGKNWLLEEGSHFIQCYKENLVSDELLNFPTAKLNVFGTKGSSKEKLLLKICSGLKLPTEENKPLRVLCSETSSRTEFTPDASVKSLINREIVESVVYPSRMKSTKKVFSEQDTSLAVEKKRLALQLSMAGLHSSEEVSSFESRSSVNHVLKIYSWESSALQIPLFTKFQTPSQVVLLVFGCEEAIESPSNVLEQLMAFVGKCRYVKSTCRFVVAGTYSEERQREHENMKEFEEQLTTLAIEQNLSLVDWKGDPVFYVCKNMTKGGQALISMLAHISGNNKNKMMSALVSPLPGQRLKVSWLSFMLGLLQEGEDIIFYADLASYGKQHGIEDVSDMVNALSENGTILCIARDKVHGDVNNSLVILYPERFLDIMSSLIPLPTSLVKDAKHVHTKNFFLSSDVIMQALPQKYRKFFVPLMELLEEDGVVSCSIGRETDAGPSVERFVPQLLKRMKRPSIAKEKDGSFYIDCGYVDNEEIFRHMLCLFVPKCSENGYLTNVELSRNWAILPGLVGSNGIFIETVDRNRVKVSMLKGSAYGLIDVIDLCQNFFPVLEGENESLLSIILPIELAGKEITIELNVLKAKAKLGDMVFTEGQYVATREFSHFLTPISKEVGIITESKDTTVDSSSEVYDCFLSHCWGPGLKIHNKVSDFNRRLKNTGYNTWFDEDRMLGNIMEAMTNGIRQSRVFVVFLSEWYFERLRNPATNVSKEFNYATSILPERFVVVLIEEEARALTFNALERPPAYGFNCKENYVHDLSTEESWAANSGKFFEELNKKIAISRSVPHLKV